MTEGKLYYMAITTSGCALAGLICALNTANGPNSAGIMLLVCFLVSNLTLIVSEL